MGCFSSRFDRRADAAGDWNTTQLQFIGGEDQKFDNFPLDRVLYALNTTQDAAKELSVGADFTGSNEE
jgi:hypothetical protein